MPTGPPRTSDSKMDRSGVAAARSVSGGAAVRGRRRGRWAWSLAYWLVVIALIAGNGWWLARDLRPAPEPLRIDALLRQQRFAEAEAELRELVRRSPDDGQLRMLLGRAVASQGRLVEMAEILEGVPYWWPNKGEALFLQGEAYNQAGLARRAEAAWKACAAEDPLHPVPEKFYLTAVESLIEIYAMQERWEEAREQAWACLDRVAPDQRLNVVFMLLRTRVQRVAPEARAPRLRRFVAADPEDLESRLALARAEAALGHPEEAERQLAIALEQQPEDVTAWRDRLSMLNERGDTKALAAAVAELPASVEEDGEIWKFRGLAARSAGQIERAATCFAKAVESRPFDEQAHYQLALAQRQLNRRPEAEASLARYKELGEARSKILAAYEEFSNAHAAPDRDPARIRKATEDLAAICRTLGWERMASTLESTLGP